MTPQRVPVTPGREDGDMTTTYVLDCSDCVGRETAECDDCIVKVLVDRDPSVPIVVDEEELRALRVLSDAGLVPAVRALRAVS